jgi:hypothetical protein
MIRLHRSSDPLLPNCTLIRHSSGGPSFNETGGRNSFSKFRQSRLKWTVDAQPRLLLEEAFAGFCIVAILLLLGQPRQVVSVALSLRSLRRGTPLVVFGPVGGAAPVINRHCCGERRCARNSNRSCYRGRAGQRSVADRALFRTRVRSIPVIPQSPGAMRRPKHRNRPRKKLARH